MSESQIEELKLAGNLFHYGIGFIFRIEGIIRVIVVNKPDLFRDVEVANDVKQLVIEWLYHPHRCDKVEWDRIQQPLDEIAENMVELVVQSGNVPKELFIAWLMEKAKRAERSQKRGGVCYDQNS